MTYLHGHARHDPAPVRLARTYDGSARRRTWRPTVAIEVEQLVQIAMGKPDLGYTRLAGALVPRPQVRLNDLAEQVARRCLSQLAICVFKLVARSALRRSRGPSHSALASVASVPVLIGRHRLVTLSAA